MRYVHVRITRPAIPDWKLIVSQGRGRITPLYLRALRLYKRYMSATCPQSEASSSNVPPSEKPMSDASPAAMSDAEPAAIAITMRDDAAPDAAGMRADIQADAGEMRGGAAQGTPAPKKRRRVNPYANADRLKTIDGRRREARIVAATKKALIEHIGGHPSAPQMMLIEQCAILTLRLRLRLIDRRNGRGELSEKSAREYLCWHNSLTHTLSLLGLQAAAAPAGPSLADFLAARADQKGTPPHDR